MIRDKKIYSLLQAVARKVDISALNNLDSS